MYFELFSDTHDMLVEMAAVAVHKFVIEHDEWFSRDTLRALKKLQSLRECAFKPSNVTDCQLQDWAVALGELSFSFAWRARIETEGTCEYFAYALMSLGNDLIIASGLANDYGDSALALAFELYHEGFSEYCDEDGNIW